MKFKIDESLPAEISTFLKNHGHDAHTVHDENLSGATDEVISKICKKEKRILLTLDKDFADIRTYPPALFYGIIVFRLDFLDRAYIMELFQRVLPIFEEEKLTGKLWIVEENKIRIRE